MAWFLHIAVSTLVGQIAFTLMLYGASSIASVFTSPMTPCLAALLCARLCIPLKPAVEEIQIILPLRLGSMCGMLTLQVIHTPLRSTLTVSSHCSSLISQLSAKE